MRILSITARPLEIPFRESFRHASAERTRTQALWVEARADGVSGHGEGCPREYVTAESMESAHAFLARHVASLREEIHDPATFAEWARRHAGEIDANPAAWTAIETALLDLFGRMQGRSTEALLGLPELAGQFRYTAVVGDSEPASFGQHLSRYLKAGFREFKIKLSGRHERDFTKVRLLEEAGIPAQLVRADANNLWSDAATAIRALAALNYRFLAVEEPLKPGAWAGMARVAAALDTRIVLDESFARENQLRSIEDSPAAWIANVRVSKMGGVMRSLALAGELRRIGVPIIVGAHVGETSLLTRAALTVANTYRDQLLAQEGAFGTHLLTYDVVDPPVMFGAGGILDADSLQPTGGGWGLALG